MEIERQKLRTALHLTVDDVPTRAYLGFKWRTSRTADRALS